LPKKSFFALLNQYKAYFILTISLFICVVSFQNCTPQLDLEEGSEELTSLTDDTPFAFDLSIDHFALMSCATVGNNTAGPFTYKWGAYQNGMANPSIAGLKLSDNFLRSYGTKIPEKIFSVLDESPKNTNLEIISGLYSEGKYDTRKGVGDATYRNNHNKLQVNSYRMDLILNKDKPVSYFPNASIVAGLSRNIEGTILRRTKVNKNAYSATYRDEFTATINDDFLSLYPVGIGFGHAAELAKGEAKPLIGEDGGYSASKAIGRSYLPQFAGVRNSHLRYLVGIREAKLDGSSSSSGWFCPDLMRFKIVQKKDIDDGRVRCNPSIVSYSSLKNGTDTNSRILRSVANVLDLSIWEVDVVNRCLLRRSKNAGQDECYNSDRNPYINSLGQSESFQAVKVDYSSNQGICTSTTPIRNEPLVTGGELKKTFYMCPHYVSICTKQF